MRYTTISSKLFALLLSIAGLFSLNAPTASATVSTPEEHRLRLFHTHTGERIDIIYKVGDTYIPNALSKLNYFLRDHRTGDVHTYDPREFDLLEAIEQKLGRPHAEIDIICGYRTPWSNAFLRARSPAVAQHSLHMQAMAIDIRIPGVQTSVLRDAALSLHRGGVGYYPGEEFVHVDVGRVRRW